MSHSFDQLQSRLAYRFNDPNLLQLALTHPSWLQEHPSAEDNNQRLEYSATPFFNSSLLRPYFRVILRIAKVNSVNAAQLSPTVTISQNSPVKSISRPTFCWATAK